MNYPYYTNLFPQGPMGAVANAVPQEQQAQKPQFNTEGLMTAVGGALGLAGNYASMANQNLTFDTPAPQQGFGTPTYTGGTLSNQLNTSKAQGASGGEIASGALQGASAGSSFGLIGAGVGALAGAATSIFGGRKRKKKQQRQIRRAKARLATNQSQYNQSAVQDQQMQNQFEDYNQRMNNRLYNLYGQAR